MKKTILLLITLACISCSKSDSESNDSSSILLKKTVHSTGNFTTEYIYDGNKLLRINTSAGVYVFHTYSGNLIMKAGQYYNNDQRITETIYTYNIDNKIISTKTTDYQSATGVFTTLYSYNADGTISYEEYSGDATNQNTLIRTGKIWRNNEGEISKIETYQNGVLVFRKENTYDDKNASFKNIIGFDKLLLSDSGNKRNIVTSKTYDANGVLTTGYSNQITYNSNDYPSGMTTTLNTGSTSTVQYYY
jgi:hypothetical protein